MSNNLSIFQIFDKVIKYIGNQLEKVKGNVNVSKDVTLWVAPDGSDTTGNGTEAKPFATIQKAVDTLGDVVFNCNIQLKSGTYNISTSDSITCITTIRKIGVLNIIGAGKDSTFLNVNDSRKYSTYFLASFGANVYIRNVTITHRVTATPAASKEILIFYTTYSKSSMIHVYNVTINLDTQNVHTYIFYVSAGELKISSVTVTATSSSTSIFAVYCTGAIVRVESVTVPENTKLYTGFLIRSGARIIKNSTVNWKATKDITNEGGIVETYTI